jgi:hypothetical protein
MNKITVITVIQFFKIIILFVKQMSLSIFQTL